MSALDLGVRARAIVAVPIADADDTAASSSFFVPTNSLRDGNHLKLISLSSETRALSVVRSLPLEHRAAEDIDVDASGTLVVVTYEDAGRETRRARGASVSTVGGELDGTTTDLRVSDDEDATSIREFETVKCARYNRVTGSLATVDEFRVREWRRRDDGELASVSTCQTRTDSTRSDIIGGMNTTQDGVSGGSWDPHGAESFACGVDADVAVFDPRSGKRAQTIQKAHAQQTRDVRHNPNKPHEMMSCGDDGLLKYWDARAHERALKIVAGHEHWIWKCAYNPVYDALALTASSDGTVRVWCDDDALPSDSRPAHAHGSRRDIPRPARAVSRKVITAGSTSVRACTWSSADPWTYAAVAADGIVSIGDVPREEKYRILL